MAESTNPYPWHHWPQQSPINLTKSDSLYVKFPKSFLKFDYRDAPFTGAFEGDDGHPNFVLDKPHSGKRPPMIKLGDIKAELVKIHLHTPSEHDVEGNNLGGEIHLIHEIRKPTSGSELLVVGVFFEEDKSADKRRFFKLWAEQVTGKPSIVFYADITSGHLLTYQLDNAGAYIEPGEFADTPIGDGAREKDKAEITAAESALRRAKEGRLGEAIIKRRQETLENLKASYDSKDNAYLSHREREGLLYLITA